MSKISTQKVPKYNELIMPTFDALKKLGGSGSNNEILEQVVEDLSLEDEVVDMPHKENSNISEVAYRLAWARTYLKKFGVIDNSARSIWSILPSYVDVERLDVQEIVSAVQKKANDKRKKQTTEKVIDMPEDDNLENDGTEFPEEVKPWRAKLVEILQSMDPYGFERLSQRVLRECGFTQVEVTKKSGDGGIDGTGKWKINGVFSFTVAFQCKRYSGLVSASDIRDFRGSLTTDIEKGILITTGTFSKAAKEEASKSGKQQIDLIDGEEFIDKIAEFGIGVRAVQTYEIDENYFIKI